MDIVIVVVLVGAFLLACGNAGKHPPVVNLKPDPAPPEDPLIDQLLKELKAETDTNLIGCPVCGKQLVYIKRLCGMQLESTAYVCKTCLKGKTCHDETFRSCHRALQDAIDATRKKYEAELAAEKARLAEAKATLTDTDSSRLFPDHRAKLEMNCCDIQVAVTRTQRWVDGLAPDIVETVAARLAEDWRKRHQDKPVPGDGPYRSTSSA